MTSLGTTELTTGGGEVTFTGTASTGNSSTTPLAGGATFTGAYIDVLKYAAVVVQFISDVAPASDGIKVDWSTDGVNLDGTDSYNMAFTGVGEYRVLQVRGRYVRVRYVNGANPQGYFRLGTVLKYAAEVPSPLGNVAILDGAGGVKKALVDAGGDAEVLQNRLYVDALVRVYDGANFKWARGDTANGLDVDVTRVGGTVTTKETRAATPAQSSVPSSATNVTLLAANASRLGATIYNDSTQDLYVKLGATASTTSFTVKMTTGAYFEVPFQYTGIIDGLWASANGNARVTELT